MEAFGKMLIHSIWAGILLFVLMKLVLHSISQQRSQLRYMISVFTLLLYTGSALAIFLILYQQPDGQSGAFAQSGYSGWIKDVSGTRGPVLRDSIWTMCCYLYAAGMFFMILRIGLAALHLSKVKASGTSVSEQWNTHFSQLLTSLRIRQKVRLLESVRITIPGVIGWIRPVVVVPAGMLTQLPANQVETILLHELFHLKRYDFLVNAIQTVLEGLFFYNPAVWLISRTIQAEREHCCDDLVVGHCETPLLYAKALYQISSTDPSVNRLVPAAGGPNGSDLSRRVLRILNRDAMKRDIRDHLQSFMVFILGIALLLIINGFSNGISAMKPQGIEPGLRPEPESAPAVADIKVDPAPRQLPQPADTIPEPSEPEIAEEEEDVLTDEEVDRIVDEARRAHQEALEEIDWEEIKETIEEARIEALEEIDWEAIKESMEEARMEVMEEIDWEAIKQEMEESMKELQEIDWDAMKQELEESMKELKEIDWDSIKKEIEESMDEIDWEQMRLDMEESMNEIDWGELKMELEQMRIHLDSIRQDLVWDPEHS
jgi:beta-lactamase regulating signal transducer with metallopeptidase domain